MELKVENHPNKPGNVRKRFAEDDPEVRLHYSADRYKVAAVTKSQYVELCVFEKAVKIVFFHKKNCKVPISVGITENEIRSVSCVFKSSVGPNVIREDSPSKQEPGMVRNTSEHLTSATNQKVHIAETVTLHVRMGDCCLRAVFGLVKNLCLSVFLDTSFSDRFVKWSVLSERKIFMYNSDPFLILQMSKEDNRLEKSEGGKSVLIVNALHDKNLLT